MKIELWVSSDLARLPKTPLDQYKHRLIFFYNDEESKTPNSAAERAWRITNAAINRLEGLELKLRQDFDSVAKGQTLGVGDLVKVNGSSFVCEPSGFSPCAAGETKGPAPTRRTGPRVT